MSEILIVVNSIGMGAALLADLNKRLAYSNEVTVEESDLIAGSVKVNSDTFQMHLVDFDLTEGVSDFLDDFWTDDVLALPRSDRQASGQYLQLLLGEEDESGENLIQLEFGSKLGARIGIIVPEFTPAPLVLNESLMGQPGIESFDVYVEHDTSKQASVTVYATSMSDAREQVQTLDDEGQLTYEDSSLWGDAVITVSHT